MPQLTDRQRNLLRFINQLNQNLTSDNLTSNSLVDFDLDINLGNNTGTTPPGNGSGTPPAGPPTSYRDLLLSLVNEQVEITTPFGPTTGILLTVQDDYVVVVENTGNQVLIRIDKIELVSEL